MDQNAMIEDLVKMLDSGMAMGVGHVNVDTSASSNEAMGVGHVNVDTSASSNEAKEVQTMGCSDCSRTPLACSVPTLQDGLDDFH